MKITQFTYKPIKCKAGIGPLKFLWLLAALLLIISSVGFSINPESYIEKIYLHTDREYYISGEPIQFKAYLSTTSEKTFLSRILTLELLDIQSGRVSFKSYLVEDNQVKGIFRLPDSLRSGSYLLLATTNWHRNLNNRFAFRKELIVVNRFGNSGKVQDERIAPAENFKAESDVYKSTLRIADSKNFFRVNYLKSGTSSGRISLAINHEGELVEMLHSSSVSDTLQFKLYKADLPAGLLELEVREHEAIKANAWLVNQPQNPQLCIELDSDSYSTRSPVQLKLNLESEFGEINKADLSVSVYPLPETYPLNEGATITNWHQVYSELDLSEANRITTSGSEILQNISPELWIYNANTTDGKVYPLETSGRIITGIVTETATGKPVEDALVFFSLYNTLAYLDYDRSDSLGRFYFSIPFALKADPGYLQIWQKPDRTGTCEIVLDETGPVSAVKQVIAQTSAEELTKEFSRSIRVYEINTIYGEKPIEVPADLPENQFGNFYEGQSLEIYPGNFVELNNFNEIAREILPGVRYRNEGGRVSLRMLNELHEVYFDSDPLVLLNGLPLKNYNFLANLGTDDIKRIDLVRRQFVIGTLVFPGVLAIQLNEAVPAEQLGNTLFPLHLEKLSSPYQLPNPDYARSDDRFSRYPDFRNTLYWNPSVSLDSLLQTITFYTADLTGRYVIWVEGFVNGHIPLSAQYEFKVKWKK